jgi:hypothetical protein
MMPKSHTSRIRDKRYVPARNRYRDYFVQHPPPHFDVWDRFDGSGVAAIHQMAHNTFRPFLRTVIVSDHPHPF